MGSTAARIVRGLALVTVVVAGVSALARSRPAVRIDVLSTPETVAAAPADGGNCGCGMGGGCCGGAAAPAARQPAKRGCGCGMR